MTLLRKFTERLVISDLLSCSLLNWLPHWHTVEEGSEVLREVYVFLNQAEVFRLKLPSELVGKPQSQGAPLCGGFGEALQLNN